MSDKSKPNTAIDQLFKFPLMSAILGRRSRRFGLGMSIPSGPLQFTSNHEPVPLSELEQAVLIASLTGVTGWHYGIPVSPDNAGEFAPYTERFTGRAAPINAAIGAPVVFYTDDNGVYLTNLRDTQPTKTREIEGVDDAARLLEVCRQHTVKLSEGRLDLPQEPPHVMEHNLWAGNMPGSTLFAPVSDSSETGLALLAMLVGSGYWLFDDRANQTAGKLEPFYRSGLLDESKKVPISNIEHTLLTSTASELAMMCHNAVLVMQAMGLGGWFYNGLSRLSVLGTWAEQGIQGLGFRIQRDERWTLPDPVGLDGHFETLGPPYQTDMREAVQVFSDRKFGSGGAYDSSIAGAFSDTPGVKRSVTPYSDEFLDCMGVMAQHLHDAYGKFPPTIPRVILIGYVQAQHIDLEFYDKHYKPGAYLETHSRHMETWHASD